MLWSETSAGSSDAAKGSRRMGLECRPYASETHPMRGEEKRETEKAIETTKKAIDDRDSE